MTTPAATGKLMATTGSAAYRRTNRPINTISGRSNIVYLRPAMTISYAAERSGSPDELLVAVADGNREAFRDLYAIVSPSLFPICVRMLRDRDAAKELLQEAFFRIWQKAHLYDPEKGSAKAWMATLTRRCVLDHLAKSRQNMVPLEDVDEGLLAGASSDLPAGSVESVALRRCLEKLEEKYSQAVTMSYCFGLSHTELANKLSVPLGTAKSWVSRGLTQLQQCMGNDD